MNDYWTHFGHPHHIDIRTIKGLCFELVCMIQASKGLAEQCAIEFSELIEHGEKFDPGSHQVLRLQDELFHAKASQVLLSLAINVRVFDDQMKNGPHAPAYEEHSSSKGGDEFIGVTTDQDNFNYRDACNKIIHAQRMRFLEEVVLCHDTEHSISYFTGEVELTGRKGNTDWTACFDFESFAETLLDIVEFENDGPTAH